MGTLWARTALIEGEWQDGVRVDISPEGRISGVAEDRVSAGESVDILLPAPANLHSHGFQRAMAGLAETRTAYAGDSFWTWRELMYRFLQHLTPDDVEAITAFAQVEMLETGFASVGEFHYLHHQPGGLPYSNTAEMSDRVAAAASSTGIGLTLLPVHYERGGCDDRPLAGGQLRFGNDRDGYAQLLEGAAAAVAGTGADAALGIAPHSLRAVSPETLRWLSGLMPEAPIHIHIAEQIPEVEEVLAATGARPLQWLFANADVDRRWCLVHSTHAEPSEIEALAASGAVAGLCPETEASLGDGIFPAAAFIAGNGRFGIGTDSNIRIDAGGELRLLEYGQRLTAHARAVLADPPKSTGRTLFDHATGNGAQAIGRPAGSIRPGQWADLVALDGNHLDLRARKGDALLDAFVFCNGRGMIADVWSAGRHVVSGGRHKRHEEVEHRYALTIQRLMETA